MEIGCFLSGTKCFDRLGPREEDQTRPLSQVNIVHVIRRATREPAVGSSAPVRDVTAYPYQTLWMFHSSFPVLSYDSIVLE